MLTIDREYDLRPLTGDDISRTCIKCENRATWCGSSVTGEKDQPMCGWCVLYSGWSDWGYALRDEILSMGIRIRQHAVASCNPKTHVPDLDDRHRLAHADAEKLMLGVQYTSAHLRSRLDALRTVP